MTWEFKVGQKVVCVDGFNTHDFKPDELQEGDIYIVRWVGTGEFRSKKYLGIHVDSVRHTGSIPFRASRFRPLVTDTQSWLKEILETPPPAPVKMPEYVEIGDGRGMR